MEVILVGPASVPMADLTMSLQGIVEEWGSAEVPEDAEELSGDYLVPFMLDHVLPKGFHSGKYTVDADWLKEDVMIVAFYGYDFSCMTENATKVVEISINFLSELYGLYPNDRIKIGRGYKADLGYYLIYQDCCKHTLVVDSGFTTPPIPMPFEIS